MEKKKVEEKEPLHIKWRPKTWDEVYGNKQTVKMLLDTLKEGKVKTFLLFGPTGCGKCLGKDTPIIMYDGSIKLVQNIKVGDCLMGDDSFPRRVLKLSRGNGDLFRIIPVKGDSFVVNAYHVLSLKWSGEVTGGTGKITEKSNLLKYCNDFNKSWKEAIFDIPLDKYLKLSKWRKESLKCFHVGIKFDENEVDLDPYILGSWLGDGTSKEPEITVSEIKILKYWKKYFKKFGMTVKYVGKNPEFVFRVSNKIKKGKKKRYGGNQFETTNFFLKFLRDSNLYGNKHIPDMYKYNSREIRLKLLAGLIDTDGEYGGNCYYITQKSKRLTEDIVYLCRSLGFFVSIKPVTVNFDCITRGKHYHGAGLYYNMIVSGKGLDEIPVLLDRKKAKPRKQIKNALITGIKKIEYIGIGNYFGFELDGNGRFLLGDFTVTHNTTFARLIKDTLGCKDIDYQEVNAANNRGIDTIREIVENSRFQAFSGGTKVFLLDECHNITGQAAEALLKVIEDTPADVYFILATTNPEKLTATIKGRCSIFQVTPLSPFEIKDLSKKVADAEGITNVSDKVLREIGRAVDNIPREALKVLEQVKNCANEEEMLDWIPRVTGELTAGHLARELLYGDWGKVRAVLEPMEDDPEMVRRGVLGYMSKVVLSDGDKAKRAIKIMDIFVETVFYSAKPGLVLMCWKCYV